MDEKITGTCQYFIPFSRRDEDQSFAVGGASGPILLANAFGFFQRSSVKEFIVFVGRTIASGLLLINANRCSMKFVACLCNGHEYRFLLRRGQRHQLNDVFLVLGLASLSVADCGSNDPKLTSEMEKQFVDLLTKELMLQETVTEEQARHINITNLEAKRAASQKMLKNATLLLRYAKWPDRALRHS
ncbi:hypothetical protein QQ045_013290 [Rhodiola kirilowii]